MKQVYVFLTFHAHEPYWDLPRMLLERVDDSELKNMIPPHNYLRERAEQGRDVYLQAASFAERSRIPLGIEATNEVLAQIREVTPKTFDAIREAYSGGRFYPILGHAHHTHTTFLHDDDLQQEIAWNQEFLREYIKVGEGKRWGYFPTEGSIDSERLPALRKAGVDYIVFPHLSERKTNFVVTKKGDIKHQPFYVKKGDVRILALPRDFRVSQDIWRPITRLRPEKVKWQGYMLGKYFVFDEEYNNKRFVEFPIDFDRAVSEYVEMLKDSVNETPDGGMILYMQDLELMGLGDDALDIAEKAWNRVEGEVDAEMIFTTPVEYLDRVSKEDLAEVEFERNCWAPEIRLVARMDGHYPRSALMSSRGQSPQTYSKRTPLSSGTRDTF